MKATANPQGFTLLEILIALAILAIAMAAVARTSGLMADSSHELKRRLLAEWVAENRLAEHLGRADWPVSGLQGGETEQAGLALRWKEQVADTPNPAFRRIEIKVYEAGRDDYALARLVGYLGRGRD